MLSLEESSQIPGVYRIYSRFGAKWSKKVQDLYIKKPSNMPPGDAKESGNGRFRHGKGVLAPKYLSQNAMQ